MELDKNDKSPSISDESSLSSDQSPSISLGRVVGNITCYKCTSSKRLRK